MVGLIYVVFVVAVVDKEEVDVWIEDHALLKLIGWLYYLNVFVGVVVVVVVMMMMHKLNL